MVGALPRQAEDRDVHAPDQAARRPGDTRAAAGRRRALTAVRKERGRALDAADDSAPLPRARLSAGGVPPPGRGRTDDRRRVRRRRPERDRLPGGGARARRAVRRHPGHRGGDEVLLRQPGLLRPAAQAQDHRLRLRAPLQRAGDQLHRARRRDPDGEPGFGVLVGGGLSSVPRLGPRPRRLHPGRRGLARAVRAARRLEGRSEVPRLAREGADQVHGRRPRAGGHARRGRAAARLRAPRLRARRPAADHRPHRRSAAESRTASSRSASR